MNELKLMCELVSGLPNMALWVIAALFAYKVVFIGSVYGVIRFSVDRLYKWLVTEKAKPPREVEYKEIRPMLDGICIKATTDALIAQLHRLKGKGISIESEYIHAQSVDWLRQAIDDKCEKDLAEKKPKNAKR